MPIKKENKHKYPKNWKEISNRIRFERAEGILCLANSMTATRLKELGKLGFCVHSITILYIKSWGFGYRTDFYVFTKQENDKFEIIISESN